MLYQIKLGSITNAQRAQKLLKGAGFQSYLMRIENPKKGDGCGYALKLNGDAERATALLKAHRIRIYGVEAL